MKQPSSPKRISLLFKSTLAIGCVLAACHVSSAAILLDYWDYNNVTTVFSGSTLGKFATANPGGGLAVNNGEIYNSTTNVLSSNGGAFTGGPVFTNGSIDFAGVTGNHNTGFSTQAGFGGFSGLGSNATGDTTTNQGSLGLFVTSAAPVNQVLLFNLSSVGYTDLTFSFLGRKAGNAQAGSTLPVVWTYSTNGTDFFTLTTISASGAAGSVTPYSFTLPTGLNNLSSFELKASFNFATATTAGTSFAIDNVQLNAATAIPEPKAIALFGLGGLVIIFGRRFRARLS
jgi:hypothetical protein